MIIKQTVKKIQLTSLVVIVSTLLSLLVMPSVFADPDGTTVRCKNGESVRATKNMAEENSILDEKDFEVACENKQGYNDVDSVVTCNNGTAQNVYADATDPKKELTHSDYVAACKDFGGIEEGSEERAEEGLNDGVVDGCSDIKTSVIPCSTKDKNPILSMLRQIVNFLAIGVGVLVVGGIVWGSMMYVTSNGDAGKTQQGVSIIVNAVIGLLLFIFMYAILEFLIPGGLL